MSNELEVVSDTGPLISLERLPDGFQWMQRLYDRMIVPPSVAAELTTWENETVDAYRHRFGIESFLCIASPQGKPPSEITHLHQGEKDALLLALELNLEVLVEEEEGRLAAEKLGIPFSGIAGQLLIAVEEKVLPRSEGKRQLTVLLNRGRINRIVFETVLSHLKTLL